MNFQGLMLTNKAMTLIARSAANKETVEFTRMGFGCGLGKDIETLEDMVSPVKYEMIHSVSHIEPNTVRLIVILTTEGLDQGFVLTEIGLYARGEDGAEILYSYGTAIDGVGVFIPTKQAKYTTTLVLNVAVGNAKDVAINADDTILYATHLQLDQVKKRVVVSETEPDTQVIGDIWRKDKGKHNDKTLYTDYIFTEQGYEEMVSGSLSSLITLEGYQVGQSDALKDGDGLNEALGKLEARLYAANTEIERLNNLIMSLLMQYEIYDGGYFDMIQDEDTIDAGDFESQQTEEPLDCGGFEEESTPLWSGGVDGGEY